MESNNICLRLVGSNINSRIYGKGTVLSIVQQDNSKYYISVNFIIGENEVTKTFLADIAFENEVLFFELKDINNECKHFFKNNKPIKIQVNELCIEQKSFEISKSDLINRLIKLIMQDESISLELIPYFEDTDFESALCSEAFSYMEHFMDGNHNIGKPQKACIIVALTFIALKYYDGDLHTYIESKFREYRPSTEYKYTKISIQNGVYKAIGDYRKQVQYFDTHSYVAVPIVLCCVPYYRLNDLFRISYDIYKKKLLFDEDITDDQVELKVYETLMALRRKDLISDSDIIKGTSYLMSKYTQSCIYSGKCLDNLVKTISRCIRLIISHLTRPEDSFSIESYYLSGFDKWVSNFEADIKEKERYENNRTISRPYFKLIHNKIHLITGVFIMDDSLDPNQVHICIYSGETLLQDKHLTDPNDIEINEEESVIGGYIVNRRDLVLNASPLDSLSYSIVCDEKEIYNSKSRLYRPNIFFDGKGNEIKPGTEYDGELFVVTHNSNKDEYDEKIEEVYSGNSYIISMIEVNSKEVFRFDGEPYIFYKITGARLIGYEVPWANFITIESKQYHIYTDVSILFQASCDKEDIYLDIDGFKYSYGEQSEISYKINLFSNEYDGNWAYVVNIYNLEPGFHTVKIYNLKTNKLIKSANFEFVYDPNIRKSFISKDCKGITYEFANSFSACQSIIYEYGVDKKELYGFVKNLGYGNLIVYPSSISYSIDGVTWYDLDQKFYLCDISESVCTIHICGPSNMKSYYYDASASVKKQYLNFIQDQVTTTLYNIPSNLLNPIGTY